MTALDIEKERAEFLLTFPNVDWTDGEPLPHDEAGSNLWFGWFAAKGSTTPLPAKGKLDEAEFEAWWQEHGQYCRAGGGDYEKTFAYRAAEYFVAQGTQPAPSTPAVTGEAGGDGLTMPLRLLQNFMLEAGLIERPSDDLQREAKLLAFAGKVAAAIAAAGQGREDARDAWIKTEDGVPIPVSYARIIYAGWTAQSMNGLTYDEFVAKYGKFLSLDSIKSCYRHKRGKPAIDAAIAAKGSQEP